MKLRIGHLLLCILLLAGCEKDQYTYKKFINGKEIVYAGLAESLVARSGNLRVQLEWQKSIDPAVVSYAVYWNNGRDSALVPATAIFPDGLYRFIIPELPEYVQSFKMTTVNDRGDHSIGQILNGIRVFGPYYKSSLINQKLTSTKVFNTDSIRLYFGKLDSTLIFSKLRYYKNDNTPDSVVFRDSVTLQSFKPGTRPVIQSYYKPASTAIDTFATLQADSLQAF